MTKNNFFFGNTTSLKMDVAHKLSVFTDSSSYLWWRKLWSLANENGVIPRGFRSLKNRGRWLWYFFIVRQSHHDPDKNSWLEKQQKCYLKEEYARNERIWSTLRGNSRVKRKRKDNEIKE